MAASEKSASQVQWGESENGGIRRVVSQVQWGESENGGIRRVVSQVQWGESENGGIRKVGVASPMGRTRKWRRPKSRRRKSNGANQKMAASEM
jgi:hypothetical protein